MLSPAFLKAKNFISIFKRVVYNCSNFDILQLDGAELLNSIALHLKVQLHLLELSWKRIQCGAKAKWRICRGEFIKVFPPPSVVFAAV